MNLSSKDNTQNMSDWFSGPWQWDDVLRTVAFVFIFILLPLAFVVFGVVSLALVAHYRVWCAWTLTLAGPLVGVGTFFRNAYGLRYAVHPALPPAPCAGLIECVHTRSCLSECG